MARVPFKHLIEVSVEPAKPCSKSVDEVNFSGAWADRLQGSAPVV